MFTTEWRTERVRRGDAFLQDALDPNISSELRIAFIAIAQAHYQAANIRSRPGESWLASKEQPTSRTLQAIQRRQQQFDPDADGDQHP
jgi:hypothetical protein